MTNEELVMEIQQGNKDKLNDLWLQVSDFIRSCAREFNAGDFEEDLVQESYFGLLEAAQRFDNSQGCKFLTFAGYYIKNSMRRFLIKANPGVRLPEHIVTKIRKYNRFVAAFVQAYGREPTDNEASASLNMPDLKTVKAAALNPASLNNTVGEDGVELIELQGEDDGGYEQVLDSVFSNQLGRDLWGSVGVLPDDLKTAVVKKYRDGKSYRQIAKDLNITVGEVRGIMSKAMRKLRTKKELKVYYDELYGRACSGNGVAEFERTWTSSTERAALWLLGVEYES